jgi:hypothetical protein
LVVTLVSAGVAPSILLSAPRLTLPSAATATSAAGTDRGVFRVMVTSAEVSGVGAWKVGSEVPLQAAAAARAAKRRTN